MYVMFVNTSIAECYCWTTFQARCVNIFCMEEAYAAHLAELYFDVSAAWRGVEIKVWGFDDKMAVLMESLLGYFGDLGNRLTREEFNAVKESVRVYIQ